jgi:GH18 family chitinase
MNQSFIYFCKQKMLFAITILLFLTTLLKVQAQPCKEVVGYYPNWQWYDRNKLVNPETIDYSSYTIINYSFFAPQPDGTILITDPWADKNLLLGPINWAVAPAGYDVTYDFGNPSYHHPGQQFSDYCHAHGVKLLPSIGGWTLSNHFPAIAADPVKRQQFAQSCVQLIQAFGFDGIDLDWEYPGYAAHNGTPQDKANFTLLLQEIRTAIDTYGASVSKPMLLTIAVGASPENMGHVEWDNIIPIVDIINVMSYDFFGSWDPVSNHNAPLFAPQTGNPDFNVSSAVINLLTVHNVPAGKIVVGFAFYGRSFITQGAPGLFVSGPGQLDLITFADDLGTPLYYNVLKQQHLFDYHWDNIAKVPYLTGKSGLNTFVSFDDTVSIRHKAEFVVENNLRGGIIWEITGDYLETAPNSGIIAETPPGQYDEQFILQLYSFRN